MENEHYVALVVYYWSSRATSSVATARERIPDASLLRQQAALFSVKSCDVLRITITVNLILHPVSRGVLRLDLSRRPIRTFPSRSVASSSFHVHIQYSMHVYMYTTIQRYTCFQEERKNYKRRKKVRLPTQTFLAHVGVRTAPARKCTSHQNFKPFIIHYTTNQHAKQYCSFVYCTRLCVVVNLHM